MIWTFVFLNIKNSKVERIVARDLDLAIWFLVEVVKWRPEIVSYSVERYGDLWG